MAATTTAACADCHAAIASALKLEVLCAIKDIEIANLKGEMAVRALRAHTGASDKATFDAATMTFTEPVMPVEEPQ
jgi:hypothetical protein